MKLRQKLAMVLASAMVVSSVPVVTSAAGRVETYPNTLVKNQVYKYGEDHLKDAIDFTITNTTSDLQKKTGGYELRLEGNDLEFVIVKPDLIGGEEITDTTTLKVYDEDGNDSITKDDLTFFYDNDETDRIFSVDKEGNFTMYAKYSTDSYWDEQNYDTPKNADETAYYREMTIVADEKLENEDQKNTDKVVVKLFQNIDKNESITIPLQVEVTNSSPSVEILSSEALIDNGTYKLSATKSEKIEISLASKGKLLADATGELGTISLKETIAGSLVDGDNYFYVKINNNDVVWNENKLKTSADMLEDEYIYGDDGFKNDDVRGNIEVMAVDEQDMIIKVNVDNEDDNGIRGEVLLKNLPIELTSRHDEITSKELEIEIAQIDTEEPFGSDEDENYNTEIGEDDNYFGFDDTTNEETIDIADIIDEGTVIGVEEVAKVIEGGSTETIKIELSDIVSDTLNDYENFYITWDDGIYFETTDEEKLTKADSYTDAKEAIADIEIEGEAEDFVATKGFIKFTDKDLDEIEVDVDSLMDTIKETDGGLTESEAYDILEEMSFEINVGSNIGEVGEYKIYVDSNNLDDEAEVIVVESEEAFIVEADTMNVKLGVKEQIESNIVITETAEERFGNKKQIVIEVEDIDIEDAVVDTDGESGLEVDSSIEDGKLVIDITDESDDGAGTITISEIEFDIEGNKPVGDYDLYIGGNAVDRTNKEVGEDDRDEYGLDKVKTIKDVVIVGDGVETKQIITSVDFSTGAVEQRIGDDVTTPILTVTPYINSDGRTMIGVGDLAAFFNISRGDIVVGFNDAGKLMVSIFNGGDVISLTDGSTILYKNGTPTGLDTPMIINSNSRAEVPARHVAEALGLEVSFKGTVATFRN